MACISATSWWSWRPYLIADRTSLTNDGAAIDGRAGRDRARGIDREPGNQSAEVQEAADAVDSARRAHYLLHARTAMINGELGCYTRVGDGVRQAACPPQVFTALLDTSATTSVSATDFDVRPSVVTSRWISADTGWRLAVGAPHEGVAHTSLYDERLVGESPVVWLVYRSSWLHL